MGHSSLTSPEHASALTIFEYAITLDSEVSLFWKGKVTGAVVLFFLNRYVNLAILVYGLASVVIPYTNEVRARFRGRFFVLTNVCRRRRLMN